MQLKCSKCQKIISISEDKLPKDKEKAMLKCPSCQQILVFQIPPSLRKPAVQADKTIITEFAEKPKVSNPRLFNAAENCEYKLKAGKNILGRDADISIAGDRYISRKHCLIEIAEKHHDLHCILTDDGSISESGEPSTNGTFYNETRLTRYDKFYLNHNDKIRIGHTELIFLVDSPANA
mgnify:CR=1 FL=1